MTQEYQYQSTAIIPQDKHDSKNTLQFIQSRKKEIDQILECIKTSKSLWIYGDHGVGKSSLVDYVLSILDNKIGVGRRFSLQKLGEDYQTDYLADINFWLKSGDPKSRKIVVLDEMEMLNSAVVYAPMIERYIRSIQKRQNLSFIFIASNPINKVRPQLESSVNQQIHLKHY